MMVRQDLGAMFGTAVISPPHTGQDDYLHFFEDRACAKAMPARDFALTDKRPSRKASDALRATRRDVCLLFFATAITSFICSTGSTQVARVRER